MMDDIAEQQDVAREISDAISNPVAFGHDIDEVSFALHCKTHSRIMYTISTGFELLECCHFLCANFFTQLFPSPILSA